MKIKPSLPTTLLLAAAVAVTGCAAPQHYGGPPSPQPQYDPDPQAPPQERRRTAQGAGLGALAGAAIGAISGDDARERRNRALIGAGVGALAGAAAGTYMDRQEARMREEMRGTGVEVVRQGDELVLNMPESITFGFDSAALNPQATDVLNRIANVSRDYPQTLLEIAGHTDNVGAADYNRRLSERRAQAVADYLVRGGVDRQRLLVVGGGMDHPVASNTTEAGRAQNRRVEITFMPVRA